MFLYEHSQDWQAICLENVAICTGCDVKKAWWIEPDVWLEEHCQVCCLSVLSGEKCVWFSFEISEARDDVRSDSFMDISPIL